MAQLDSASDSDSEGHRFESDRVGQTQSRGQVPPALCLAYPIGSFKTALHNRVAIWNVVRIRSLEFSTPIGSFETVLHNRAAIWNVVRIRSFEFSTSIGSFKTVLQPLAVGMWFESDLRYSNIVQVGKLNAKIS